MKIRRSIVAAGAAAVLGGTAALLIPAAASAHDATHTHTLTVIKDNSRFGSGRLSRLCQTKINAHTGPLPGNAWLSSHTSSADRQLSSLG
jgi:hypothetical protein